MPGKIAEVAWLPKNLIAGITTSQAKTPPENQDAGDSRPDDVAHAKIFRSGVGAERKRRETMTGYMWECWATAQHVFVLQERIERAEAHPAKTRLAKEPPLSPATSTSAQAVPSG